MKFAVHQFCFYWMAAVHEVCSVHFLRAVAKLVFLVLGIKAFRQAAREL